MKLSGLVRRRNQGNGSNNNNNNNNQNGGGGFAKQVDKPFMFQASAQHHHQQQHYQQQYQQQQQQQQQQQKQHGPAGNSNPTEMSSSSVSSSLFSSGVMTTDSSMLVDDLTGPLNFSIDRSSSNSHAEYHSSSYPSTTSANASASVIAYPSHLESTAEEQEDEDGDDDDQDDDVSMRSAGNSSQYSEEGDASMSFASNSFHNGTNTLSTRSVNSSTKHHKQRRSVHFHRTVTIHDLGHAYTNTMPLHQVQQLHAQERPPLTPQDIVNRWYTRDECASFKKHMLKSVKSIRKIEDLFKAKNRTSYMMNMQTLYEECMQLHNSAQQQQQQQDYIPIRTDWFTTLKDVPGNLHTVGLEKFAIHNMHQTIIHARRQLYSKIAQLQQQHGLVDSTAALSLHKEATKPQQQQQQQQQQQRNQTTTLACNPVLEQELADISRQMTRANRLFYTYLAQVKAVAQEDDESATTTSVESPLSTNARRKKRGKR
mmetsp:Transcript_10164/g.22374  ORF Transcript_10164/g.22374 Transcript_10164/m.22374 type:complete len:483 (-) Transcript_10164:6-1454(-)